MTWSSFKYLEMPQVDTGYFWVAIAKINFRHWTPHHCRETYQSDLLRVTFKSVRSKIYPMYNVLDLGAVDIQCRGCIAEKKNLFPFLLIPTYGGIPSKNVFHFLLIIIHGLILSNSLPEYTYSLSRICGAINSTTWKWTTTPLWYTRVLWQGKVARSKGI